MYNLKLNRFSKELRLECQSHSGIVPRESYIGNSSFFDIIWEVACHEVFSNTDCKGELDEKFLSQLKEEIVNKFMILQHKYGTKRTYC